MKYYFDKSYSSHYVLESVRDELKAIGLFLRYQWPVVLATISGLVVFLIHLNPIPPSKLRMSSGPPGSSLEQTALTFAQHLRSIGIVVETIPSNGGVESLALLENEMVDVALTTSSIKVLQSNGIESLGSVEYQPLWLFANKDISGERNLVDFIKNKKIYIGRQGSATYKTAHDYLTALFPNLHRGKNLRVDIGPNVAVNLMRAGRLDGMFLVAGFGSKNVNQLIDDGRFFVIDFPEVESLVQRIAGTEKVKVSKGMFSLWPPFPNRDVNMVASTSVLLVKSKLHPAIQYALLEAAKNINSTDQNLLNRNTHFPKFIDPNVKRSKIAERYYEKGLPTTWGHFPYWLATLIDTAGFKLLGLFALIFTLYGFLPRHRRFLFEAHASSLYCKMFSLYHAIEEASDPLEIDKISRDIQILRRIVNSIWVPKGAKQEYAILLNTMLSISKRATEKAGCRFASNIDQTLMR